MFAARTLQNRAIRWEIGIAVVIAVVIVIALVGFGIVASNCNVTHATGGYRHDGSSAVAKYARCAFARLIRH